MMIQVPSPIEKLSHPLLTEKQLELFVKRDDLTHPEIMGNKWRKLKYNIQEAKRRGFSGLLTLGGAYSNHIAATAAAANENQLKSIGIIRGDELDGTSNSTLEFAIGKGMQLHFVDREHFRSLRENPTELVKDFGEFYFLPEGGTNELAIKGCEEIIKEINIDFDVIAAPIGTGGTLCGLIASLKNDSRALGISSLKGEFIKNDIHHLLKRFKITNSNYEISTEFHFGGYARTSSILIDFINWFKENFNIPLDPIYTGKSFFGVWEMIKNNKFEKNLKIVLLHTGGLQGIEGFNRKNENIIQ